MKSHYTTMKIRPNMTAMQRLNVRPACGVRVSQTYLPALTNDPADVDCARCRVKLAEMEQSRAHDARMAALRAAR